MKILIVDDKRDEILLLETILKRFGYEVVSANNGEEALKKLRSEKVDLIISDILMPVMDGFLLCKECKRDKKLRNIPFLFLTATYLDDKDMELGLRVGADEYIRKPIDPEELIKIIKRVCAEPKQRKRGDKERVEEIGELRLYNERLIKKLEDKMMELEKELQLRKGAEERYQVLTEESLQGILVIDEDFRIVYTNPALEEITGYNNEELLSFPPERVKALVLPEDQALFWGRFKDRLEGKDVSPHYEFRAIRKDGEVRWLEIYASRIEWNGKSAVQAFFIDITERKRAEEALQQSEERYRALVEESFDGIFIQKGPKIIYANKRLYEMLGYEPGELEGRDHWVVYHPEYQPLTRQRAQARMRGEEVPSQYEVKLQRKDGSSFDGEVLARRIMFGEEPGIQVWVRDISERKKKEELIKASEERYRTLVESSSDAILLLSPQREIISCNQAVFNLYGYNRDEIIGKSVRVLHASEESFRSFGENVYPVVMREGSCRVEWEFVRKDGSKVPVEIVISAIKSREGVITGYVNITRDITERKRAEESILKEKERFQILLENAPFGMVMMDKEGRYLYVNLKFKELFGYDLEDIPDGRTWFRKAFPDPEFRHQVISAWKEDWKDPNFVGEGIPRTFKVTCKDGKEKVLKITPVRLTTGEFLISFEDLTEVIRAEVDRRQLEEQLRQAQKMEAIGTLAGGIAHDFNNILSVIKGMCQLSLLDLDERDPLYANLKEIERSTDRAADLTRQLLAFSRKQILEPQVLDLNQVIQRLEKMLRRVLGEDIELVTFLSDGLGRVKVDPGQIEQVIMNLVVNARDAMPRGGKLTLETANVELDEAYARRHIAVNPGQYVMLSISDTGVGMSQEVKERVFEAFFTTKEKGRGTGLGLSTVYGIVKQSGGNIWVYSEPGQGTTFKIYLPRVEAHLSEVREEEIREVPSGNETVLVVEDEEAVRKLAVRLLKRQGYQVLEASGGGEAFILCEKYREPIHLILSDVVMPGINGRELVERLQRIHPEAKALYMSGYTDNVIIHHGILKEGIEFIQKPFTLESLARKVREVLDK